MNDKNPPPGDGWGFVYIAGNRCMPGIYKIGMTRYAPSKRLQELSGSTACPAPFDLIAYIETSQMSSVEAAAHELCRKWRVSREREFFRLDDDRLAEAILWLEDQSSSHCRACALVLDRPEVVDKINAMLMKRHGRVL